MTTTITPTTIKSRLDGLRGGAYFDTWKDFWTSSEADPIRADVQQCRDNPPLTPAHLVRICDRHNLPWKTFVEQLEKDGILRTGIYEAMPPIGKMRAQLAKEAAQ